GFTRIESSYYYIGEQHSNFTEARKHCQHLGGDLATINHVEENIYLANAMKSLGHPKFLKALIGLNDIQKEGEFKWVNGEEKNFVKWCRNEPNNSFKREHCVELVRDCWNDVPCGYQQKFICEVNSV
uniref:C-type lectin domain-containing protein n=1 Tax=Clytia hemisphaerica TaxID=252671 RepID=A0A7M5USG5_9CNID